ncbi:hypothetical protein Bbelb_043750 [Branchiostoma belcheri]|nr:hypothetical protein Bbelb_043750 [Branchiostoma belcheri]
MERFPRQNVFHATCRLSPPAHAYKLQSAVIAHLLHVQLESLIPESQTGFRPARDTRNNVYVLKWTTTMLLRESKPAVVTFIDYAAADTEVNSFSMKCSVLLMQLDLEYADDAGLIGGSVQEASERNSAIACGSRDDTAKERSAPNTKAMHVHRKDQDDQWFLQQMFTFDNYFLDTATHSDYILVSARGVSRTLKANMCGGDNPPDGSLLMDCKHLPFNSQTSKKYGNVK